MTCGLEDPENNDWLFLEFRSPGVWTGSGTGAWTGLETGLGAGVYTVVWTRSGTGYGFGTLLVLMMELWFETVFGGMAWLWVDTEFW